MRKKSITPLLVLVVIFSLGVALALVIGFFQISAHIQSSKLCRMINAGNTESAIEYLEKVADVNEYSAP